MKALIIGGGIGSFLKTASMQLVPTAVAMKQFEDLYNSVHYMGQD